MTSGTPDAIAKTAIGRTAKNTAGDVPEILGVLKQNEIVSGKSRKKLWVDSNGI